MISCSLPLSLILFLKALSSAVSFIPRDGEFGLLAVGYWFDFDQKRIFTWFQVIWILFLVQLLVQVFFSEELLYFSEISLLIFLYIIDNSFNPSPYWYFDLIFVAFARFSAFPVILIGIHSHVLTVQSVFHIISLLSILIAQQVSDLLGSSI